MPIRIPAAIMEEHEEVHRELERATRVRGEVGEEAKKVAKVLHPHFQRENELALPVIGILRELAENQESPDFQEAFELCEKFKLEYRKMLEEHEEIVKALDVFEKAAKRAKKRDVVEFAGKLKLHAKTEEDLTYPAVLIAGKLLSNLFIRSRAF